MQNTSDAQLLRDYIAQHSDPAFAEIVARHTDLVYSAAVRQTGSPELAREIAQSVFTDLARKARALAGTLSADASLAGWLFRGTRFAGLKLLRDDQRRQTHERQFMEHFHPASESAPDWERIAPVLDEAMAELDDADHEAVLLRYFQNQDFHAVGLALGVSDDTAQKRVSRAVERLREYLAQRGVKAGASGLVVLISVNGVLTAPAGLSAAIAAGAIATAATVAITHATVSTMSLMNAKSIAAMLSAALLVGTTIYFIEEQRLDRAAARERVLLEQQTQLVAARDTVVSTVSEAGGRKEENGRPDVRELARLRNETTLLRQQLITAQQTSGGGTKPAPIGTPPLAPGQFVSKEQLAFAGYATPEAALQSMIWATVSRDFLIYSNSFLYDISSGRRLPREGVDMRDRVEFEGTAVLASESFQGLQILARKAEGGNQVLVIAMTDGFMVNAEPGPRTNSFRMWQSGNSWKFGGMDDGFNPNSWFSGNNIQKFVP